MSAAQVGPRPPGLLGSRAEGGSGQSSQLGSHFLGILLATLSLSEQSPVLQQGWPPTCTRFAVKELQQGQAKAQLSTGGITDEDFLKPQVMGRVLWQRPKKE